MVKNKILKQEFKEAKEALEFIVGKGAYFTMDDGHTYAGIVIGIENDDVYLKNIKVLDVPKLPEKTYIKVSKKHICAQIFLEEE